VSLLLLNKIDNSQLFFDNFSCWLCFGLYNGIYNLFMPRKHVEFHLLLYWNHKFEHFLIFFYLVMKLLPVQLMLLTNKTPAFYCENMAVLSSVKLETIITKSKRWNKSCSAYFSSIKDQDINKSNFIVCFYV
jgi:hypothetical protein